MAEAGRSSSIRGGWLGTRLPRSSLGVPVRFEATFTGAGGAGEGAAAPGAFGGTVLDDSRPAPDRVDHGLQTGRHVRFRQAGGATAAGTAAPVHYQGTLSPDGQAVSGTWERTARRGGRAVRVTGHWEARRLFWPDDTGGGRS